MASAVAERTCVINGHLVRQRLSDLYVNGGSVCKDFGKDVYEWKRNRETQPFLEAISKQIGQPVALLVITTRGRSGTTWLHPDVAMDLFRWLSPDFAAAAARFVRSHLEEVCELGGLDTKPQPAIAQRQAWTETREENKECNKDLSAALHEQGCGQWDYRIAHGGLNRSVFDYTARELEDMGLKDRRKPAVDYMTKQQLNILNAAKEGLCKKIRQKGWKVVKKHDFDKVKEQLKDICIAWDCHGFFGEAVAELHRAAEREQRLIDAQLRALEQGPEVAALPSTSAAASTTNNCSCKGRGQQTIHQYFSTVNITNNNSPPPSYTPPSAPAAGMEM